MIPDVFFNEISLFSLGWLRESVDFPTPQSQSETLVIPGRNTPLRFSTALGRVAYAPREFTITLSTYGTRAVFNTRVMEAVNRFAGQLVQVVLTEYPESYAWGTLEAQLSYDPMLRRGRLIFTSKDADSFLYHMTETVQTFQGNTTATLRNDFMPVIPTIETSAETTLNWSIGADTFSKTLSAGSWTIPELELSAGINTIGITTTGSVSFRYREGHL